MNKIHITHIVSRNCGGYGAWMVNPLSSPAPDSDLWKGFQLGGGGKRRRSTRRNTRRSTRRNTRRNTRCNTKRKSHKSHKSLKRYKKYKHFHTHLSRH